MTDDPPPGEPRNGLIAACWLGVLLLTVLLPWQLSRLWHRHAELEQRVEQLEQLRRSDAR